MTYFIHVPTLDMGRSAGYSGRYGNQKTGSKHPSLPHIIATGLILIALELHWSWELSTPRERQALAVAAMGEAQSLVSVAAWAVPGLRVQGGMR